MKNDRLSLRHTAGALVLTAALAALTVPGAATAAKDPDCEGLSENLRKLCDIANTPPATTPSSGGSSNGFSNAVSDFFNSGVGAFLFFGGIAAVIAWVVIASRRESAEETEQHTAATHARGRQIALDASLSPVEQSPADLARFATFGWAVPHVPGTAFGNLVNRDGSTDRVNAAWAQAAEIARLGHADEKGVFVPAATVVNVNGYADGSGDLELSVNTADYTVAETQLNRVLEHLVRTARVETASAFSRDAVRDWHITRLSMTPAAQQAAAPEQEQSAPDPTEQWEW